MKGERASDLRRAHERWAWHTTNRAPHEELPRPLPLPIPFPSLTPSLSNLHHPRSTGGAIKEITLGGGVDANDDGGSGSRRMNFNTIIATKSSHPPFRQKKNRVPPPPHPICLAGRKKRHVYLLVCDEDALPCRPPRRAAATMRVKTDVWAIFAFLFRWSRPPPPPQLVRWLDDGYSLTRAIRPPVDSTSHNSKAPSSSSDPMDRAITKVESYV